MKISILGLAYKENTNSIKNSPSLKLISYLSNFSVLVHDPAVKDDLPCFVERKETINQCINGCDLLIIATPWEEYKNLRISDDSSVSIQTDGLFGKKFLLIEVGGNDVYLKNGEKFSYAEDSIVIEELLGKIILIGEKNKGLWNKIILNQS